MKSRPPRCVGIRIIKSYVWEESFLNRVKKRREFELKWVRKAALSRAFLNFNITLAPLTMAVVSFSVFAALGGVLTPEVAFTSIALFNVIKLPLFFFPAVLQVVIEALISYRRIQEFLALPEAAQQVCGDHGGRSGSDLTPTLPPFGPPQEVQNVEDPKGRDAFEGEGPQRRPQKRLDRRLEEVAKAVGGGYCRIQMPLKLAFAVREIVAGYRLGALKGGGGGTSPSSNESQ